jgi:hypothetical protein
MSEPSIVNPWREDVWFSPFYVVRELDMKVEQGKKLFSRELKQNREAWIAAVAMTCYAKDKPQEWWVQVPKKDPPDVLGMNIILHKDKEVQDMVVSEFEVFEINQFTKESIEQEIERKLYLKNYSGMVVIAYLRREGYYDLKHISNNVRGLKHTANAVCILMSEKLPYMKLVQVYPNLGVIEEDYRNSSTLSVQSDILTTRRSTKIDDGMSRDTNDKFTLIPI